MRILKERLVQFCKKHIVPLTFYELAPLKVKRAKEKHIMKKLLNHLRNFQDKMQCLHRVQEKEEIGS